MTSIGEAVATGEAVAIGAACLICACLLFLGYRSVESEIEDRPWDVVVTGDSIIGKERYDGAVDAYFEEYSGLTMVNGAFGGNCAALEDADRYSYQEESITLPYLAEAICYKDFGVQWADMAANQTKIDYFEEVLRNLAAVDFEQTKILMLSFGTNDYLSGKMPDDPENPYNIESYGGALRYSIELLKKTYPDLEIILVTPLFCHIPGHENCLKEAFGGGTMDEYAKVQKAVAAEYGVYVIDVLDGIGIDESNYEQYTDGGGLHLNKAGREMYARFLAEKTGELLEEKSK